MLPFLWIVLAIIVIVVVMKVKESFADTSYYYEAAPGARGARMVCMPEATGTASLGIAVGNMAGDCAARAAKDACSPLVDDFTANRIAQNTFQDVKEMCKQYMTPMAPAGGSMIVPPAFPMQMTDAGYSTFNPGSYLTQLPPALQAPLLDPSRPGTIGSMLPPGPASATPGVLATQPSAPPAVLGSTVPPILGATGPAVKTSPGCPTGMIWDGKRCRLPRAASASKVKTSPGCPSGMIWDGRKCRKPSGKAKASGKTSPGCPRGMVWSGSKCKKPSGKKKPKGKNKKNKNKKNKNKKKKKN